MRANASNKARRPGSPNPARLDAEADEVEDALARRTDAATKAEEELADRRARRR